MIYQLIRRDPAWKAMPWLALVSAVVWAFTPPIGYFGAMVAMVSLFVGMPQRRASRFAAALPIEARDLLLARTLSLMAVVWIPALSGAVAIILVKGFSAPVANPLALGALATLMAALAQSAWLKELAGPMWIPYSLFMFLPVAGAMMAKHPAPLVPALCFLLVGIGLFVWAWKTVPRSFQLSEQPVGRASWPAFFQAGQARSLAPLVFRWAPVMRSVCSWQYLFFVTFLGFLAAGGQWLFLPFWLVMAWQSPRTNTRWLWSLPVGRRALLWTILGPILAAHVLGYFVSLGHRYKTLISEPRVAVVTLAAILGLVMLTLFFCVLADWRGFAHIPRRILNTVFVSLIGIWFVASFAVMYYGPHGSMLVRDALVQFSLKATVSLPALIAAAAAVLIALYLAVEKVFSEPDFADKPKVSQPDAFA